MRALAIQRVKNLLDQGAHFDTGRYQSVVILMASFVGEEDHKILKKDPYWYFVNFSWDQISDEQILDVLVMTGVRYGMQR